MIRDGQPIGVHSGVGVNGQALLFWGRTSGAWDNLVECIQLVFPGGGRSRIGISGGGR